MFSKSKKKLKDARGKTTKMLILLVGLLNRDRDPEKIRIKHVQVLPQCCHLFSLRFIGVITGTEGKLGNHFVINS